MMMSGHSQIQQYDNDLLQELRRDDKANEVIALTPQMLGIENDTLHDATLSLPYLVYAQILAFHRSLTMGFSVDNPCPTGEYNRVVKGVTIYPLCS